MSADRAGDQDGHWNPGDPLLHHWALAGDPTGLRPSPADSLPCHGSVQASYHEIGLAVLWLRRGRVEGSVAWQPLPCRGSLLAVGTNFY